jgi:hypothetical protein
MPAVATIGFLGESTQNQAMNNHVGSSPTTGTTKVALKTFIYAVWEPLLFYLCRCERKAFRHFFRCDMLAAHI